MIDKFILYDNCENNIINRTYSYLIEFKIKINSDELESLIVEIKNNEEMQERLNEHILAELEEKYKNIKITSLDNIKMINY